MSQLRMNAMIKALQIMLLTVEMFLRRSEMPICKMLVVVVIAVAGAPAGMESMT